MSIVHQRPGGPAWVPGAGLPPPVRYRVAGKGTMPGAVWRRDAEAMSSLFLEFAGEELEVEAGSSLTFGRGADLVVDAANRHLHNVLGRLVSHDGRWYLQNLGRYTSLVVLDREHPSRSEVAPGDQIPLGFDEFIISFDAGAAHYEIEGAQSQATPLELGAVEPTDTVEVGVIALTDEQVELVAVLAEAYLRGVANWTANIPTNKEASRRLGWKLTKYNRKLDYLCRRLAEAGVTGLVGDTSLLASHRRQLLVEHVTSHGLVSVTDLDRIGGST